MCAWAWVPERVHTHAHRLEGQFPNPFRPFSGRRAFHQQPPSRPALVAARTGRDSTYINSQRCANIFDLGVILLTMLKRLSIILCMNKLSTAKRVQIVKALVEGNSLRSITRMVGVSINTVTKLLVDLGAACEAFHDANVRNVPAR